MVKRPVRWKDFSYDLKWYLTDGYTYRAEDTYLFPGYVTFAAEDSFYVESSVPEYYEEEMT